jgi:hypothetical protein
MRMAQFGPKRRFSDMFIYIVVGLLVVLLCVLLSSYAPNLKLPDKWLNLGLLTAAVFGYLLKAYWRSLKLARFWIVYSALLGTHLIFRILVLRSVAYWPLPYLVMSSMVEFIACASAIHVFAHCRPDFKD